MTITADGTSTNITPQYSSANASCFTITWNGLAESSFDGYEYTGQPDRVQQFSVDTCDWPNRIQWGNPQRSYIRVTMDIASQTTAGTNCKQYHFYYAWTGNYPAQYPDYQHIDEFTGVFAPISEMQEVAPETFLKWLERIGHDDAFLRVSYKLQKRMMKHTGQKPPWDPRKIKEIEEGRQRFMQRARELLGEEKLKTWEEKLYERWGIREIPPITPELLDQIVERSTAFLKECLSEEELKWYDEEGHIKVRSTEDSNIFYVIEKKVHGTIERWVNNKHVENICYQSEMSRLPLNDTLAMKVLDVKYNEKQFLKVGNRRAAVARCHT